MLRNEFESKKQRIRREHKEMKELLNGSDFEKGDLPALIIAALTTILPFAIIIFLLLFIIPMLVMGFF